MCSSSCSYFQDTSIVWKLCWRCGTVVRVRGELSGWDGVGFVMCCQEDFLHAVLSSWVEMNFDDDVEEESDCCLRKEWGIASHHEGGGGRSRCGRHPGALITGGRGTCREICHSRSFMTLFSLKRLITLALSDLNVNAFWFMAIGLLFLLQGIFVLTKSLCHRTH